MTITYAIAFAAARDAGNRAMKAGGRKVWSRGDYLKACAELERLWPSPSADSEGVAR